MQRALTTLLAGTLLLTACGGQTVTTTQSTDQEGVTTTGDPAFEGFEAFDTCLEEQGLQGMGGGGGFAGPPPGDTPGERPTDPPSDLPSDLPTDGPGEFPQRSAADMEARQDCAEDAGIDMAPDARGPAGCPAPEVGSP